MVVKRSETVILLILLPFFAFGDNGMAYIGAALAVGLSSLAAGIAVGLVGAAAMGTIGEKPELSGRALIFIGLAEGIAIYGLIVAILILGKIT